MTCFFLRRFLKRKRKREGWKEVKRGSLGVSMDRDANTFVPEAGPIGFVLDIGFIVVARFSHLETKARPAGIRNRKTIYRKLV